MIQSQTVHTSLVRFDLWPHDCKRRTSVRITRLMEEQNGFHASGRFNGLEDHLEQFIERLRVVGVVASDFQPGSQPVLDGVL